jgi:hypothetical protein
MARTANSSLWVRASVRREWRVPYQLTGQILRRKFLDPVNLAEGRAKLEAFSKALLEKVDWLCFFEVPWASVSYCNQPGISVFRVNPRAGSSDS